jgi:TonB family protein
MPLSTTMSLSVNVYSSYKKAFVGTRLALLCMIVLSTCLSVRAQEKVLAQPSQSSISILDSTREEDGLSGPVRRIYTEMTKVTVNAGATVEGPRMLSEVTTYDPQGKRIWNVYYPVGSGSFKGNQEFTYDEQGHVKEMTLRDESGRILSREAYTYEFDSFGNWTKMASSLVIFEGGKINYEPFEVSYRTIAYYFDDSVAQIVKSSSTATSPTVTQPVTVDDKSKLASNATASVEKPETLKQTSLSSPVENVLTKPVNTPLDKKVPAGETKPEASRDVVPEPKRDVDVVANPTTQAYQMPEKPIVATASGKQAVSGGVVHGKVLSLPKPAYPSVAAARGVLGKVEVEVTLDEQGRVIDARALNGNPFLRASAVAAARQARFEPTLLSGLPVKATRLIDYDFKK